MLKVPFATAARCAVLAAILVIASTGSAQAKWTVDATPVVRIGSDDAGSPALFSRVAQVLRLSTGDVVVVDGASYELRFFDSTGRFLRRAGGKGRGPSEFVTTPTLAVEAGSIRAFDGSQEKIATFTLKGDFTATQSFAATGGRSLWTYSLIGYIDGGPVFVPSGFSHYRQPATPRYWDSVPNLMYTPAGVLRDTIGEFSGMDMYTTPTLRGDVHLGRMSSAAVFGNRFFFADGGPLSVRVYNAANARVMTMARPVTPRAVTVADKAAHRQARLARAKTPEGLASIHASLDGIPYADAKPWISSLVVDESGHLWVEQWTPEWDTTRRVWQVFDPRGAWVTEVALPTGFRLKQVAGDLLHGVRTDEDGVESVEAYRIRRR